MYCVLQYHICELYTHIGDGDLLCIVYISTAYKCQSLYTLKCDEANQTHETYQIFVPPGGESHLLRTDLHVYSIVKSDQPFLIPSVLPGDIGEQVSTTKSRVLKFFGNKFGNLLYSAAIGYFTELGLGRGYSLTYEASDQDHSASTAALL